MINITIIKSKQNIITIEATGHSGYGETGTDIVCSAVSTLTENLINSLIEIVKVEPNFVIDEEIPHLRVSLNENLDKNLMKDCQILMRSTVLGLKNVANGYSKFIKIKEKQHD